MSRLCTIVYEIIKKRMKTCLIFFKTDIIIGLDNAGRNEFEKARHFFKPLPQNVHILIEEQCVEVFSQSIITAGESFVSNPMETPFIPNWNRILSTVPDIGLRLVDSVLTDNES